MYEIEFLNRVSKYIKKEKNSDFKKEIENQFAEILKTPLEFEALKGDLAGIYSTHFHFNKTEYRIAYYIDESKNKIIILQIGKRENFYKELKSNIN